MVKVDQRTRRARESEVLEQIGQQKGCTIFWATDNRARAAALMRLEKAGRILRMRQSRRDHFPWMVYRVIAQAQAKPWNDRPGARS